MNKFFLVDVQEIKQNIDSFIETMNKTKSAYIHELHNPSPEDEEDDLVPSKNDFGGNESNLVGVSLSRLFMIVKDLLNPSSFQNRNTMSLVGMAGIGKTSLAKKLFQDQFIASSFTKHVFVTIGPQYKLEDILVDILTQTNPEHIDEAMLMKDNKELVNLKDMVLDSLMYLSYLMVLDNVWDRQLCLDLLYVCPQDQFHGSLVLVTTRIQQVARCVHPSYIFKMPFLDKKESWDLLRHKVFDEMPCPLELEEAGKKIAENCEGLPLTILTVADILSKSIKTTQYWSKVAAEKQQNSVYKDAYNRMMNVLYPSYNYLEQHLKACFLYFGTVPQNNLVNVHHMTNLWRAEGFVNREPTHYSDTMLNYIFDELKFRNIIFHDKKGDYSIPSPFWYLCNKEAAMTKLFYALNCRADALLEEGINHYQRRLCIRNSILLAIEDVRNLIASASTVRSLLCTGDFHKYPVPLYLENSRLLKVLDALSVRFYEFPMEVLKLVQLRYLALVYNGNLPTFIYKLKNLQYLIVTHRSNINFTGNLSYFPIEIWNMNELKDIHTSGRDLPHPPEGSLLPNLLKLGGVNHKTCTKEVFEKIPNLEFLLIGIELDPHANTKQLSCFDHISCLHKLEVMECYIRNPSLKTEVVSMPLAPLSHFPSSLTQLVLDGSFEYPWEEMRKISSLPNLSSLTVRCYAFRGPKWEVHVNEFQRLKVLRLDDIDLVHWKFLIADSKCLPVVRLLKFGHCYRLKEIPVAFGSSLRTIHVIDCNPMVVDCANKLKNEWENKYARRGYPLALDVISSQ